MAIEERLPTVDAHGLASFLGEAQNRSLTQMCGNLGQGPSETMITDDDLLDLPEDPELAFVQSERRLRKVLLRI
jgi:hypothetical protein